MYNIRGISGFGGKVFEGLGVKGAQLVVYGWGAQLIYIHRGLGLVVAIWLVHGLVASSGRVKRVSDSLRLI